VKKIFNRTCKSCLNFECCRKPGFPAFLTEKDVERIENRTGLSRSEFAIKTKYKNRQLYFLRQSANGCCIFWDGSLSSYKKCKIYPFRPLDCKLFPLDLVLQDGVFILIKYSICNGSGSSLQNQIKLAKSKILPGLKKYLREYATWQTELYKKGYWEKLEVLDLIKHKLK